MAAERPVLETLSLAEARRLALAAQGFTRARPRVPKFAEVERTAATTQLFQIDSVSVVVRAHYMPLFSRLGPYDRTLLETAAYDPERRSLFEYWAHEASLVPLELHPFFRWRMERAANGVGIYKGIARFGRERHDFVTSVLNRIRDHGPTAGSDFEGQRGSGGWWGWSDAKLALEWLFWAGKITTSTRRSFERVYDLMERVIPPATLALPTPDAHAAHLELVQRAVRALGVGTRRDILDYFRTAIADTDPCIRELVESGVIVPVQVEGLAKVAYRSADARLPRSVDTRALLSPFDPIVWERDRTHDLFGFHYRIEIYTPAKARKHGYYVLPFLFGDRLVARVDLKADKRADCLRVLAAHDEDHAPDGAAEALAQELLELARWLGLARVVVGRRGSFIGAVRSALRELT